METETGTALSTKRVLEALLFASEAPLRMRDLRALLPETPPKEIAEAFARLGEEYDGEGRSFRLVEIEGGWQLFARKEYFPWIRRLRSDLRPMRLSRAALETLAIIAYRQPATRAEIEHIRGVDAGGVLRTLLDRNLIALKGRAEGVGRPLLYGTTDFFLNHFGLKSLEELPKTEELSEIMKSKERLAVEAEVEEILAERGRAGEQPGEESPGEEEELPQAGWEERGEGEQKDDPPAGEL
ncbi:MAG: SMC-Scp complex subunit ScpB [Candidatus Eisenbacteria bacterium]